jgi:hypothetical protein
MHRMITVPLAALALAAAGCEADEEVFEEGATLEPPPAVEEAPLTDDVGPERLEGGVVAADTLQEVNLDVQGDTAR